MVEVRCEARDEHNSLTCRTASQEHRWRCPNIVGTLRLPFTGVL